MDGETCIRHLDALAVPTQLHPDIRDHRPSCLCFKVAFQLLGQLLAHNLQPQEHQGLFEVPHCLEFQLTADPHTHKFGVIEHNKAELGTKRFLGRATACICLSLACGNGPKQQNLAPVLRYARSDMPQTSGVFQFRALGGTTEKVPLCKLEWKFVMYL